MIPSDLLPPEHMPNAFIAGGYAACPATARDIDVWISYQSKAPGIMSSLFRKSFIETAISIREWMENHYSDVKIKPAVDGEYSNVLHILQCGTIEGIATLPIQVMLVKGTVEQLLETFDISTHQIALTPRGVITGSQWTPLYKAPKIISDAPHHTTPERLERFRERYKHYGVMYDNIRDVVQQMREVAHV